MRLAGKFRRAGLTGLSCDDVDEVVKGMLTLSESLEMLCELAFYDSTIASAYLNMTHEFTCDIHRPQSSSRAEPVIHDTFMRERSCTIL